MIYLTPHMVLLNSDYEVGTSGGGEVVLGPDPSATYYSPDRHLFFLDSDGLWHCLFEECSTTYPADGLPINEEGWVKNE